MKLSQRGLEHILSFEGKLKKRDDGRYEAYLCPAGVPTIYAGCTEGVHLGMIVTEAEGETMFRREIDKFEKAIARLVTVDMSQGEYDACVSLAYNIGIGAFTGSSVLRYLNKGKRSKAAECFGLWNKARKGGKGKPVEMRGLTRRRAAETALFLSRETPGGMPQEVEQAPSQTPAVATAGTLGGGLGLNLLAGDPVGMTSAAVALKGNTSQLLAGVDLTTWGVPALILLAAGGLIFYLRRTA